MGPESHLPGEQTMGSSRAPPTPASLSPGPCGMGLFSMFWALPPTETGCCRLEGPTGPWHRPPPEWGSCIKRQEERKPQRQTMKAASSLVSRVGTHGPQGAGCCLDNLRAVGCTLCCVHGCAMGQPLPSGYHCFLWGHAQSSTTHTHLLTYSHSKASTHTSGTQACAGK